jgi:hypothetical protein
MEDEKGKDERCGSLFSRVSGVSETWITIGGFVLEIRIDRLARAWLRFAIRVQRLVRAWLRFAIRVQRVARAWLRLEILDDGLARAWLRFAISVE